MYTDISVRNNSLIAINNEQENVNLASLSGRLRKHLVQFLKLFENLVTKMNLNAHKNTELFFPIAILLLS